MATIPVKQTASQEPAESLDETFQKLAAIWLADTAHISSTTDLVAHPAFQGIVNLVLPSFRSFCGSCKIARAIGTVPCNG